MDGLSEYYDRIGANQVQKYQLLTNLMLIFKGFVTGCNDIRNFIYQSIEKRSGNKQFTKSSINDTDKLIERRKELGNDLC